MAEDGFPWHQNQTGNTLLDEKDSHKYTAAARKRSGSLRSNGLAKHNVRFQQEPQRPPTPVKSITRIPVRTVPAWIQDATEEDVAEAAQYMPDSPQHALIAHHNFNTEDGVSRAEKYPMSSGRERDQPTSRWISFARASAYPRENLHGEKVEPEWLDQNMTDYSKPWLANHNGDDLEAGDDVYRAFRRQRRAWYTRAHHTVMRNPFIPLGFRLLVITFAAIAMGLGASIWHENRIISECIAQPQGRRSRFCGGLVGQGGVVYSRDPSALMTIIVDAVSIIYSIYITYDEYFSKPLGLRSPAAKLRLVLLDLFFIVFQAATISLVFNSLHVAYGPCKFGQGSLRYERVCTRANALSAMLLISLLAWMMTFSVSILRYVYREAR